MTHTELDDEKKDHAGSGAERHSCKPIILAQTCEVQALMQPSSSLAHTHSWVCKPVCAGGLAIVFHLH